MEFEEALDKLKNSEEIKKIDKENYLAHGFISLDENMKEAQPWNLGYYNPSTDKVTTFAVTEHVIEELGEEEIFKEPDAKVEKLEIEKINKKLTDAIEIAKKIMDEKYKAQIPTKTIILLQNLKEMGTIWNITIVTKQMSTLNIKIDAENGEIKEDKLTNLMEYRSDEYK